MLNKLSQKQGLKSSSVVLFKSENLNPCFKNPDK